MKKQTTVLAAGAIAAVLSGPVMADFDHIKNGDFAAGIGSKWSKLNEGAVATFFDDNGRGCVTANQASSVNWHVRLYQTGLTMKEVESYTLSFDAWSTKDLTFDVDISDPTEELYRSFIYENVTVSSRLNGNATKFSKTFRPTTTVVSEYGNNTAVDGAGQLQLTLGAGALPVGETVCFDNVKLIELGGSAPPPPPPPPAAVEVNQHGYSPDLVKVATYQLFAGNNPSADRDWELVKSNGTLVTSGKTSFVNFDLGGKKYSINDETQIIQVDRNSGELIHHIDFSSVTTLGTGYKLRVKEGSEWIESHPFDIASDLYSQMKYDALSYFYHNRQGIEIEESIVGAERARGVGHPNDIEIETFECVDNEQSAECYKLDGSKGWYDAGDHGKYVVNGGISAWTLMNQYERSKYLGRNMADFATDTMKLPSNEIMNNLPDILDEVKWEMDFLLNMQVPAGKPYAGMAFHRMNNTSWTSLPTDPSADDGKRYAHAPTTGATLNLAATAAQCARVFKPFDEAYANKCLAAAEKALAAAEQYPERYAAYGWELEGKPESLKAKVVLTDPANNGPEGAGLYNDLDVSDEFFWAYAELYATTKKNTYKSKLTNSAVYGKFAPGSSVPGKSLFTWQLTNMLGAASIATVGEIEGLDSAIVNKQIELLKTGADSFVEFSENPGYSTPAETTVADWGSNSNILNNMVVLGLVNDLECEQGSNYINAIQMGMTYLLGNNPNSQSYVSGYGENALENPHHRFWAHQKEGNNVSPPPGAVSGGPNTTWESTGNTWTGDPLDESCAAEACFVDNIDAWSVNEITVNWNSPFAWAVAYLDEYSQQGKATTTQCANREITLGGEPGDNTGGGTDPVEAVITASFSAPANNSTVTVGDSVSVNVTATSSLNNIEKVTFKVGNTSLGQDSNSPYAATWNPTVAGTYSLTATVVLTDGTTKDVSAINVTVKAETTGGGTDPVDAVITANFTAPSNNSTVTVDDSVSVKVNASSSLNNIAKVIFKANGVTLVEDSSSPYATTWEPASAGSFTLKATVVLNDGSSKEVSAINVTVKAKDVPVETPDPSVITASITSPSSSTEFEVGSPINMTVSATSNNNDIANVLFYVDGEQVGQDSTSIYSASWTPSSVGTFELSAKVVLNDGTTKTVNSVNVNVVAKSVDAGAPDPEVVVNADFTAPLDNSIHTEGDLITLKVNASATNATIKNVKFYQSNVYIGQDSTAPYSVDWTATTTGTINITAKVTLTDNTTEAVPAILITVNEAAEQPDTGVSNPDDGGSSKPDTGAGNGNGGSTTKTISAGATSPWLLSLGLALVFFRRRAR